MTSGSRREGALQRSGKDPRNSFKTNDSAYLTLVLIVNFERL